MLTSVEICSGAGGQALGLEQAGFSHLALVEIDPDACQTLRTNRPRWNVVNADLQNWDPNGFGEVDLLAGGVPCPPFSVAGRQLGSDDERDLFPRALQILEAISPRALMFENVRGLLDRRFDDYRENLNSRLRKLGYAPSWRLLNAVDFGVPQIRQRVVLVAIRQDCAEFNWPQPALHKVRTVGEALVDLMASEGWLGAEDWAAAANAAAPTLVGGSKKHGGPDLGPTRAREAWKKLGVDGSGVADSPPGVGFEGMPKLTVRMAARVQAFPDDWLITGKKTSAYRQVGNALPPPIAKAVGLQIKSALVSSAIGAEVAA